MQFRMLSAVSTKVTDVYRVLREGIATGAYKLGEPLRAAAIASELGISRTPVREAFMRLASEGLVDYSPRYGARVSDLDPAELEELFELRAGIEAMAIRHTCLRATPAQVGELRGLAARCREAVDRDDVDAVIANNIALHDAINRLSGRRRTIELVDLLRDRSRPYRVLALYDDEERRASLAEHDRLVDLIEQREPEAAVALLHEHFRRPLERLTRYLGEPAERPRSLAS